MIDSFCIGIDLVESEDLTEEARSVVLKNAEAFLRSNGKLTLRDWYGFSNETKSAFMTAGNRLMRERAVLVGLASQSENYAAQIMSANDGGNMLVKQSIDSVLKYAKEKIEGESS
tara:strand:- start:598 stop:942 length:345 start_codon:yes stop_codon:yes gene_type:complete